MARVLVIGYGNPLRGDDGLGWHAAQHLAPALAGFDTEIITCHQLTPELSEAVSRADRVLFVDARTGGPPGALKVQKVTSIEPQAPTFSHRFEPAALLAAARRIYGASPEGFVLSVVGRSFAYSEQLSSEVQTTLPELVGLAREPAVNEGSASPGRKARGNIQSSVGLSNRPGKDPEAQREVGKRRGPKASCISGMRARKHRKELTDATPHFPKVLQARRAGS